MIYCVIPPELADELYDKMVEYYKRQVAAELSDGDTVRADEILVAAGRHLNTTGLGLQTVGVPDDGPLATDEHLRVSGAEGWLYAIGDVNGRALLTHEGKYQARVAADHLLGRPAEISIVHGGHACLVSPMTADGSSGEDADSAGADEQTDHDQYDTPDHLFPDDREDTGDHQDDRNDP